MPEVENKIEDEEKSAVDASVGTASWKSGEKVWFETTSTVDAAETRISIDYYDVAD